MASIHINTLYTTTVILSTPEHFNQQQYTGNWAYSSERTIGASTGAATLYYS